MDKLVEKFLEQRALSQGIQLNEPLYKALLYLEKSNELVEDLCNKNQSELIKNVPWPTMHDMYRRNYEYCCGVISCFLIGQLQSSEALCRTAIEGAVNLHYVSLGDSMSKQIAYFKNHLVTERKQNRNWKESVEASGYPQDAKDHHLNKILEKEGSLTHYEEALRESLRLAGVDFDSVDIKWPSIFDRFKEIGDEVGYRTVYAALCSQAHNDAEDILNKIMSRVIDNISGMEEAQWIEQYNFSLYLLLTALDYHITASAMYIARFNIKGDGLVQLKKEVIETTCLVIEQGPKLVREKITAK
ncbi:hypothetical protein KB973_004670 [Vibrio parahaemolyticus]|uniref:DUF5677 domain-containing protein n=1 Tax=Vibrio parahaemolyticus TaxID=670 RepID=UPI001120B928|nr:DUF5677 domain-containing protein [Vibrio parahaemolyticus]EHK0035626.1 hypothetical protein [Vibrio parahaemolyticus]TOQ83681.1 hypothetical protein CGG87_23560 [Vibrio parahaemolyticus]